MRTLRVVVALGGNALLRRGERPDSAIQIEHVSQAAPALAKAATDHGLVLVHGNGPQVGLLALENGAVIDDVGEAEARGLAAAERPLYRLGSLAPAGRMAQKLHPDAVSKFVTSLD